MKSNDDVRLQTKISEQCRTENAQLDEIINNVGLNHEKRSHKCGNSHHSTKHIYEDTTEEDQYSNKERNERLKILWDEHYMETYWHQFSLYCDQHGVDECGNVGQKPSLVISEVEEPGYESEPVPDNALLIDCRISNQGK